MPSLSRSMAWTHPAASGLWSDARVWWSASPIHPSAPLSRSGQRASTWRKLSTFWTAPGFASELMHLYLATGLTAALGDDRLQPDADEHLELRRVPLDEALRMVEDGSIADAKSILGVLWLDRLRRSGER